MSARRAFWRRSGSSGGCAPVSTSAVSALQPDEWDEVRQFLRAVMREGEKIEAFCRRVGLPYLPTWGLLTHRHLPSPKTAAKLRVALGAHLPPMPGEDTDFLTDTQVAAMLGVSRGRVAHLKRDGVIASVGSGRNGVFYLRPQVEALCEQRDRAKAAAVPRVLAPRHCRRCKRPLTSNSQLNYCSRWCSDSRKGPAFSPQTALGRAVNERREVSGKGLTKFAEEIGIDVQTLKKVLTDEPIWIATFNKINAALGGSLPPPTSTVNDVRSEEGKQLLKRLGKKHPFKSSDAKLKANATRRGSKRSVESIAKQRRTHETSPAWAGLIEGLRARKNSPEWHARLFLISHLRTIQELSDGQLNQLARDAVSHLGSKGFSYFTVKVVLDLWRPTLIKRGLKRPGGRPRKDEKFRADTLHALMREEGWDGSKETRPRGFDQRLAVRLNLPLLHRAGQRWRERHSPDCPECTPSSE